MTVTTQLNNINCSYASKLAVSIRIIVPSKYPPLPSPQHTSGHQTYHDQGRDFVLSKQKPTSAPMPIVAGKCLRVMYLEFTTVRCVSHFDNQHNNQVDRIKHFRVTVLPFPTTPWPQIIHPISRHNNHQIQQQPHTLRLHK